MASVLTGEGCIKSSKVFIVNGQQMLTLVLINDLPYLPYVFKKRELILSRSIHSMKFFIRASPYTTNRPLLLIASDVSVV